MGEECDEPSAKRTKLCSENSFSLDDDDLCELEKDFSDFGSDLDCDFEDLEISNIPSTTRFKIASVESLDLLPKFFILEIDELD